MNAIALPAPAAVAPWRVTPSMLYAVAFTMFFILGAVNLSLVRTETERKCDTRPGGFSSGWNRSFQTFSCECNPPFHFAEACPTPVTIAPATLVPSL
jgi:hypothetical protein